VQEWGPVNDNGKREPGGEMGAKSRSWQSKKRCERATGRNKRRTNLRTLPNLRNNTNRRGRDDGEAVVGLSPRKQEMTGERSLKKRKRQPS